MQPISVYLHPMFGGVILVVGVLILGMALMMGAGMLTIVGLVQVVAGLLFMSRPVMVFTGEAVELKNQLGMTLKTVSVTDPKALEMRGNSLHYQGKKILWLGLTNRTHLQALREAVRQIAQE